MAVYIDNLVMAVPNKNWPYKKSCHLIADTEKELHAFAECIGLKRSWFQENSSIDHYDLTASKRVQAVKNGARQLSMKQFVKKMREARRKNE
jgi:hypothetical protein